MTDEAVATIDPGRFVRRAAPPVEDPSISLSLHLSDRPLVVPGQRLEPGLPLVARFREQEPVAIPTTAAVVGLPPGATLDQVPIPPDARRSRTDGAATYRARVVEHGRDGITRLVAGFGEADVASPVAGVVERVSAGRIDLRAEGVGIRGPVGWGRPAAGRIVIAADAPDAEIRATSIDVGAAGAVLVVGARIDLEAISRARAIGVAAIVTGGVAGRDLRQLGESEVRQQAALHAAAPFAFLALGGFGRAAVPRHLWDLLVAAEGRAAGIVPDDRLLVVAGDRDPLLEAVGRAPGTVRVAVGPYREREGRLVGLAGPRRWPGGTYAPGGFVELDDVHVGRERVCLPLAALERLG